MDTPDAETPPMLRSIDPREAHLISMDSLLRLLPHVEHQDVHTIRCDFASWLTSRNGRQPVASWQDAFNAWTRATPTRPGEINYRSARCHECRHGIAKRPSARNLSRTGNMMGCGACGGTGRGGPQRQVALFATPRH